MNWICPNCNEELGELNGYCLYCKHLRNTTIFNPDKYFIRDIRIYHLCNGAASMTPQEELFQKLFNGDVKIAMDMPILERRAKREELADIAFRAKVGVLAIDHVDNEEKKARKKHDGATGFERSLNVDETSTNAINTIRERQKKLTGKEKIAAGLAAMYEKGGMSKAEAEAEANKAMGAGAILARLKDQKSKDIITGKTSTADVQGHVQSDNVERIENKPFFNPFEKKENK